FLEEKMVKGPRKPELTVVGTAGTLLSPPRKLGKWGSNLWNRVQTDFDVNDCAGIEILTQICQAADLAEELRETRERDGATLRSRGGLRAHPCLKDELSARGFIVRGLAKLGIAFEPLKSVGRPPVGIGILGDD